MTLNTAVIELWRVPRVMAATGLSRPQIHKLSKIGQFPKSIQITSRRCVGWRSDEVQAWIATRIREGVQEAAA